MAWIEFECAAAAAAAVDAAAAALVRPTVLDDIFLFGAVFGAQKYALYVRAFIHKHQRSPLTAAADFARPKMRV